MLPTMTPPEALATSMYVYVPISREMIEEMNGQWSKHPLFVKFEVRDDGTAEMWLQRPAPREGT